MRSIHECTGSSATRSVQKRPTAWPPELLLASFSRTTHPNKKKKSTLHYSVSSATQQNECEIDRVTSCQENQKDRGAETPQFFIFLCPDQSQLFMSTLVSLGSEICTAAKVGVMMEGNK